ncbi:hypothetical protein L2E82_31084 [Cichorium intybus]|uniref:Uncharacterized protein n=1 Tax=Cichorium intybus TaxID=13427 RepID=A0ACB9D2E8_CICIN|nr:hypothetical protein L2E82_31084 [Cichorium intybus]
MDMVMLDGWDDDKKKTRDGVEGSYKVVQCGSRVENHQHHPNYVSLATLMSREVKSEKMEKPYVRYGCAAQSRKGKDYCTMKIDCQRALPRALVGGFVKTNKQLQRKARKRSVALQEAIPGGRSDGLINTVIGKIRENVMMKSKSENDDDDLPIGTLMRRVVILLLVCEIPEYSRLLASVSSSQAGCAAPGGWLDVACRRAGGLPSC